LLDQLDLPVALPELELLFARDRFLRRREYLDVHEAEDAIFPHERRALPGAMLLEARANVVGDANVERPVMAAGEDVDVIAASVHERLQSRDETGFWGNGSWPSPGRRLNLFIGTN
jgi:hypothetical protein